MAGLPKWERGTSDVLCAAGPHPIPISTAVRAGDDRLLFALGTGRETLRRVERVQDHLADGRTEMLDGARWRWLDERMDAAEDAIVVELGRLAG